MDRDGDQGQRHDDSGQGTGDVVAAFQHALHSTGVTDRQPGNRDRRESCERGTCDAEQQGLFQSRQQLGHVPDFHAAGDQPFAQGDQGHAQGQGTGHHLQRQREQGGCRFQAHDPLLPGAPRTDASVTCRTPGGGLGRQHGQATQRQHTGQHVRRCAVEGRFELIEDRGGKGVEADHGVQAIFGQQVQADQQGAAADRQAQLRQHNAEKHFPGFEPHGLGDVFDGRIEPAQSGRYRQIQEREVGDDRDQDTGKQAVNRWHQADPGVTVNERRHRQRCGGQQRPPAPPRQIRAFGQPCQRHPQCHAQGNRQQHQQQGVDQQLTDPRAEHQGHDG
ncbi:hypothetical protein D3C73_734270 [compost metagenome]